MVRNSIIYTSYECSPKYLDLDHLTAQDRVFTFNYATRGVIFYALDGERKGGPTMSTLEEFAALFKNERRIARRTLRELAEAAGKSIGYLSDVEQGRKLPPSPAVVTKIEKELGIQDGRLVKLAEEVRRLRPTELMKMISNSSPAMTQMVGEFSASRRPLRRRSGRNT